MVKNKTRQIICQNSNAIQIVFVICFAKIYRLAKKMANKVENNYKINPEKVRLETDQGIAESEERKWGMPLKDVYKHGLAFYKGIFPIFFIIMFMIRHVIF